MVVCRSGALRIFGDVLELDLYRQRVNEQKKCRVCTTVTMLKNSKKREKSKKKKNVKGCACVRSVCKKEEKEFRMKWVIDEKFVFVCDEYVSS